MSRDEIASRMKEWGFGADLIARVVRLNPNHRDGDMLRGLHLAPTARSAALIRDEVSKGAFIRLHGRSAWEKMPRHAIRKDGKRAYVSRSAVEDNLWMAASSP